MWNEGGFRAEIRTLNLSRNSLIQLLVVCRSVSKLWHRHAVMTVGLGQTLSAAEQCVVKCEISRTITLSQKLRKRHRGVKLFKPYTRRLISAYGVRETAIE
jgi:hypothetical protein